MDNVIEFYKGADTATLSLIQGKWVNKVKKLAVKHPDEVDIKENTDGSIFAHVPVRWIKISPLRQMSEEQRKAAGERMAKAREVKTNESV